MSRAAEEAYERWAAQHELDCAKHFTLGAKVWRTYGTGIEEGTVTLVSRCDDERGWPKEDGKYPLYIAAFGVNGGWREQQIHAWRFFWDPEHARAELGEKVRRDIEDKEREIVKLRALLATLPPPLNWP